MLPLLISNNGARKKSNVTGNYTTYLSIFRVTDELKIHIFFFFSIANIDVQVPGIIIWATFTKINLGLLSQRKEKARSRKLPVFAKNDPDSYEYDFKIICQ